MPFLICQSVSNWAVVDPKNPVGLIPNAVWSDLTSVPREPQVSVRVNRRQSTGPFVTTAAVALVLVAVVACARENEGELIKATRTRRERIPPVMNCFILAL